MSNKTGIGDRSESLEEEDLRHRSTKKVKGGNHDFSNDSTNPVSYVDIVDDMDVGDPQRKSYKETVLGIDAGSGDADNQHGPEPENDPTSSEYGLGGMQLKIIEKQHGGHECPEIVIPPHAEERLCKPWRQGLLVKLLGRRIGYKALENRLNQMWVEKGVMNIMDLGSDFYLVYLSSQADYDHALSNGPWLIYDHYLTVREWRPNFRPEKEEINRVAVWVRLPELPVEYYDPDLLDFLGNRIGRTVKVDKTTQMMARGKYARLCVEIDLDAPLLAMFEIKGHIYKIEYEGLHLLCMTCGRFGHHKDQCPAKETVEVQSSATSTERRNENSEPTIVKTPEDGPWKVVQKQRWPRKGRDNGGPTVNGGRILPTSINRNSAKKGSRFDILQPNEEILEEREEQVEPNSEQTIDIHGANQQNREVQQPQRGVSSAATKQGPHVQKKVESVAQKKVESVAQKKVESVAQKKVEVVGKKKVESVAQKKVESVAQKKVEVVGKGMGPRDSLTAAATNTHGKSTQSSSRQHQGNVTSPHVTTQGPLQVGGAPTEKRAPGPAKEMDLDTTTSTSNGPIGLHPTKPPDITRPIISHTPGSTEQLVDVGMVDSEEFMDASEEGELIASDSDMEVVIEPPTSGC